MRDFIRERLVGLGCKSVPAKRTPRSFGAGFLRVKRFERARATREAVEALRAERENSRHRRSNRLEVHADAAAVDRLERALAERDRCESNAEYSARREAERAEKRARRAADIDRLRQLGGVKRSQAEELEFLELLVRHNSSKAYFESRAWERRAP